MALIKGDVSDQDIENLFDNNDTKGFTDNTEKEDSLIPAELDVKSEDQKARIERPTEYQPEQVHQKKLLEKKQQEALKSESKERLLQVNGTVSRDVFNEVAKARQQAQLEEFIAKQRKLPKIAPTARYPLYGDQPKCNFHVFQPTVPISGDRWLCACKFCSQEKIFTMEQWKQYELENRQFM